MYDTAETAERFVLIAVIKNGGDQAEDTSEAGADQNLDELSELVRTAGGEEAGRFTQRRYNAHPAHYFGKGRLEELRSYIDLTGADAVACDDELTNAQIRGLERALGVRAVDRSTVILDIFARRAVSAEGKIQVELAQQRYNLSHLAGVGSALSRLGGGIGTRGPGEKKLETDRRHIRESIYELERRLEDIKTRRTVLRERRVRTGAPVAALVGYTNAGKSTLMNAVSGAGVLTEDKLFATLDTTTRRVTLPGGSEILLTDTVGFIRKLPHALIRAFRATLEEARYADILLHVADASSPDCARQMDIVYETLDGLGCGGKLVITVFNKTDLPVQRPLPDDRRAALKLELSAKEQTNIGALLAAIEDTLKQGRRSMCVTVPYDKGHIAGLIHGGCEIVAEEYAENGTYFELYADDEMKGRLEPFKCERMGVRNAE